MPDPTEGKPFRRPGVLSWAVYLGMSWTWVIGMYLPVLLVRPPEDAGDGTGYGLLGFLVFAVPNVVGAALMGFVLRGDGLSEAVVRANRPACLAFSVITLMFHAFAVGWFLSWTEPRLAAVALIPVVFRVVEGLFGRREAVLSDAWLTLIASLVLIPVFVLTAGLAPAAMPTAEAGIGLLWLAPVCVLGFLLCPYLDLTFHRGRQALPKPRARAAFAVGFGAFFFAMILFTLTYAPWLDERNTAGGVAFGTAGVALFLHITNQATFTVRAHLEEMGRSAALAATPVPGGEAIPITTPAGLSRGALTAMSVAGAILLLLGLTAESLPSVFGMSVGEAGYRLFLSFYGLVFPAYVYLCMWPTRDGHAGLAGPMGRRKLRVLALTVGVAAPMYFAGFIVRGDFEPLLLPGVAVVLLARLLLPKGADSQGVPLRVETAAETEEGVAAA